MNPLFEEFFSLLRFSLGIAPACHCEERSDAAIQDVILEGAQRPIGSSDAPKTSFSRVLTAEEWRWLHEQAKRQCLLGVLYKGIEKLPAEHRPPRDLLLRWSFEANQIAAMNTRMNDTAAKLTKIFADRGARTVILKGQANARLYPDPSSRQAGDIDILVQGGRNRVLKLLKEMELLEKATREEVSNLHAHLDAKLFDGVTVEVHFMPTYNNSPFTTRNMQRYFDTILAEPGAVKTMQTGAVKTMQTAAAPAPGDASEGFNVPPATFALVMQLSHMQRHFVDSGLGLRQLMDYYHVLRNSTQADRDRTMANLKKCGLYNMARATMWILEELFGLPQQLMLCAPDPRRGRMLLDVILADGNFGHYSENNYSVPLVRHWLTNARRYLDRITFDMRESLWGEFRFVTRFVTSIPYRIKTRRLSLRK